MEIMSKKKLFSSCAVGTERLDSVECTVTARRRPLSGSSYEVLLERIDGDDEYRLIKGSYPQVLGMLTSEADTKEVVPVLMKVAEAIQDPEMSLARGFADGHLYCLAAISAGPKNVRMLATAMKKSYNRVRKLTLRLRREGLVRRADDDLPEYDRLLSISEAGKKFVELLREDKRFMDAEEKASRL